MQPIEDQTIKTNAMFGPCEKPERIFHHRPRSALREPFRTARCPEIDGPRFAHLALAQSDDRNVYARKQSSIDAPDCHSRFFRRAA